jgi:hypothetical protein
MSKRSKTQPVLSPLRPPEESYPVASSFIKSWLTAWDQFWFTRRDPTTLAVIRILTGLIAFYSQAVWSSELMAFFGHDGLLPVEYRVLLHDAPAWSHFDWVRSPTMIWAIHWLGLLVVAMFTLGIFTRATSVLTAALLISYTNRATGALFGLDQIMVFLCLYLAVGNSGGVLSVDGWWKRHRGGQGTKHASSTEGFRGAELGDISTNIAIRLIQLHLCLVYLFAGLGKLQGETWWNGQAIWFSVASYEYQTMDLTWIADYMWLGSLITLLTVFWEVTYPALIWPRLTRPFVLAFAVITHLGIGLAMGMMTFGLIMLVANFSFVDLGRPKHHYDRPDG